MQKTKFFRTIIVFLVLVLGLSLSGCSSNTKDSAQAVTLYWWRSHEDANEDVLNAAKVNFEEKNPNIKIEVVLKDPRTYEQEATNALASYKTVANAPDILSIRGEDLPRFATLLNAAPDDLFDINITSAKKKTGVQAIEGATNLYQPIVLKQATLADSTGKKLLYGLPMAVDNLALYKNSQLFNDAKTRLTATNKAAQNLSTEQVNQIKKQLDGKLDTWEKLAAVIPYLKVTDGANVTKAAVAMGAGANVERSYDILETIMMQNGTQMTSSSFDQATFNLLESTTTGMANPGQEALNFYLRFSNPQDALYTWNDKMPDSYDAFVQGQTALMFQYASAYRFLKDDAGALKNSIDVLPMPQALDPSSAANQDSITTMGRMWLETVPSAKGDANRLTAAWKFVQYITSKEGSKPYLSAMKMPSALKSMTSSAKFEVFNSQAAIEDTWYKGHEAMKVDEIIIAMIDDVYKGRKSAKDALDSAAAQTTTILKASNAKWAPAR